MKRCALLIFVLFFIGCAAIPLVVDGTLGAIGVYQRFEDRTAQQDQNKEIKLLREEIRLLRELLIEQKLNESKERINQK